MRESSTLVTGLQEEKVECQVMRLVLRRYMVFVRKVELEQQLSEALQMVADQSERDSQNTSLLQAQLEETTNKLTSEEQVGLWWRIGDERGLG